MIRQKSGRFYFGPNNNGNKNVERLFLVKGITLHFFFSSKFTLKNPQCNNTLENCTYLQIFASKENGCLGCCVD